MRPFDAGPVAVQVLPLYLPIASLFLSVVAVIAFSALLYLGHRRHELAPVRNRVFVAVIVASLVLQIGSTLNQLNILPTDIWQFVSLGTRVTVAVSLITLVSFDPIVQGQLDRLYDWIANGIARRTGHGKQNPR